MAKGFLWLTAAAFSYMVRVPVSEGRKAQNAWFLGSLRLFVPIGVGEGRGTFRVFVLAAIIPGVYGCLIRH